MLPGKVTVINAPISANEKFPVTCPPYTTHFMVHFKDGAAFLVRFGDQEEYFSVRSGGIYYEQNVRYNGVLHIEPATSDTLEGIFWQGQ